MNFVLAMDEPGGFPDGPIYSCTRRVDVASHYKRRVVGIIQTWRQSFSPLGLTWTLRAETIEVHYAQPQTEGTKLLVTCSLAMAQRSTSERRNAIQQTNKLNMASATAQTWYSSPNPSSCSV